MSDVMRMCPGCNSAFGLYESHYCPNFSFSGRVGAEDEIARLRSKLALAEGVVEAARASAEIVDEMLYECEPLVDHNSQSKPPHRLCMACGMKDARSRLSALRARLAEWEGK